MINPRTRHQDKIGLKALKKNVIPEKDLPDTVHNPMTQRYIKANGKVHKELMAKGVLPRPKTNHCTRLYKKFVRCGVKFHDDDLHRKKTGGATPQCNNEETFMLTNVKNINERDLLITPSGYCFSIKEIVEWIKSKNFTNINPHVNETLFNDLDNIEDITLKNALSKYFTEQRLKRDSETNIITTHLDTFYLICKTGGICYFDQLHNFVQHNSGAFEASIEAITNLMTTINSISDEAKRTVFLNLQSYTGETLTNIIHNANAGTMCIHGVGTSLLSIFVRNYLNTERKNEQQIQPYDPLVTCIHFFIEKCGLINFTSMNSRQSIKPNTPYHKSIANKFRITEQDKTSTLFMKTDKSQHACSIKLLDIPDWRKIQLKDGNCFDLLDLIRRMTEMLNTTNGINPSPIYPMITDTEDLKAIRRRIIQNYITVSMPLQTFLMNPEELWSRSDPHKWREKCIKFFESNMRYVREFKSYTLKDGLSIIGFWDKKLKGRSFIETLILQQLDRVNKDLTIFNHKRLQSYTLDNDYYFNSNVINTKEIEYDNTGLTDDAKDDNNDLWA